MIDWTALHDARGDSGVIVGELLDRLAQAPDASRWEELDSRLVVEAECCCSAGPAALPALSRLARSGHPEQRDRALDLAGVIARTLHRHREDDRLVRADPRALAVLHQVALFSHCATRLAIVIGDHGHYSAIRHDNDGDIHRVPLRPVTPADLRGVRRWMHDTAVAGGDTILADGLTHLFGRAGCGACGSRFDLADWFEAENSPTPPV